MVDKLFEDSVLFASIGIFHIAFGDFFDELIDSGFGHKFKFLFSSVIVVETSFFYFFLFVLFQGFFDILLVSGG
jgi:hypothetical protein